MASIPNNIVAKDSDGNIKKIDLDELLSRYVKTDDVQGILSDNWPDCIVDARLVKSNVDEIASTLDSPLLVERITLATAQYGDSNIIDSDTYVVAEPRTLSKSTDAYSFSITASEAEFGICSTKKCFLYLTIDGLRSFGSNETYDEEACRATGAHGGNPIILDWTNVNLGEGGTFRFSYKDEGRPFGIYGTLVLSRRVSYVGNLHVYNFTLNFTVCGSTAWDQLHNTGKLTLQTTDTAGAVKESEVDFTSLTYPKIASIGTSGESQLALSSIAPSILTFKGEGGVTIDIANADASNAVLDEKQVSIGLQLNDFVGNGLAVENGKIVAPTFIPASGNSGAIAGLVPSANAEDFDDILTASGWKSFEEIGLSSILKPFVGASEYEDGDMGFVPQPTMTDRNLFLKGDGTWKPAIESIDGTLQCDLAPIEKELVFGVNFCDASGEWMMQTRQCSIEISPTGVQEGNFEIELALADIHGVCLCSPWSAEIPVSDANNGNGWVADKTYWATSKTDTFSAIFGDGSSVGVWLTTRQDANNPDKYWTVVNFRAKGSKTEFARPFILSIDGAEQSYSYSMADNATNTIAVSGSVIKVWPTSTKTRILSDPQSASGDMSEAEEPGEPTPTLWGGYNWVNNERTAMLQSGALTYIGDPIHPISVLVSYQAHPQNSAFLIQGIENEEEVWDIILQENVVYNDVEIVSGTIVGHVWKTNNVVKAASQLWASWSIQPILQETNEEITVPSQGSGNESQQEAQQTVEKWITIGTNPTYVLSLGLEFSKTENGIEVHSPLVNIDDWPLNANGLDIVIDCGYTGDIVELGCLTNWLNTRFTAYDRSIASIERNLQTSVSVFTGATNYVNGMPGLVPMASPTDQHKVLMGDGTWSDDLSRDFVGSTGMTSGQRGLVPTPEVADNVKYLKGDGTWSIPCQAFNAVTSIDLEESAPEMINDVEIDLSSVAADINQLFAADPYQTIYVAIPSQVVGTTMPTTGRALQLQMRVDEDYVRLYITELIDGEAKAEIVSNMISLSSQGSSSSGTEPEPSQSEPGSGDEEIPTGITPVEIQLTGDDMRFEVTGTMDSNDGYLLQFDSVKAWTLKEKKSITNFIVTTKHTTTGETLTEVIDFKYIGATEDLNSSPGFVPIATPAQRFMFLRADGNWVPIYGIDSYKGVATLTSNGNVIGLQFDSENTLTGEITADSINLEFAGATASEAGLSGLVPQPSAGDQSKVLSGAGTWIELPGVYQGATDSADGVPGLVPSAASASRGSFLRGDGVWSTIYNVNALTSLSRQTNSTTGELIGLSLAKQNVLTGTLSTDNIDLKMVGATAGANGAAGLVPQPSAGDQAKVLAGDGTWKAIPVYQGASFFNNGVAGLVPAASSSQRNRFLKADGTWASPAGRASGNEDGLMSAEDKAKLDGLSQYPRVVSVSHQNAPTSYNTYSPTPASTNTLSVDGDHPTEFKFIGGRGIRFSTSNATWTGTEQDGNRTNTVTVTVGVTADDFIGAGLVSTQGIISVPTYSGATSNANGTAGLVPAATPANRNNFLKGDGTWAKASAFVVTDTMPTASDEGDVFFYIED